MKIAVITANLGNFDPNVDYAEQSLAYDFYKFTDENFPPRFNSMTPRLQARIVKMFGWQMVPPHDLYIWVDSSCILSVAYDDEENTLYIRFTSSAIYRYSGVPAVEYDNLIDAPSKGRYFVACIKGRFPHTKMREKAQKK